jgi:hypothetical protein
MPGRLDSQISQTSLPPRRSYDERFEQSLKATLSQSTVHLLVRLVPAPEHWYW